VEKCGIARQATDGDIIWRMRFAWWISKATDISEYALLFHSNECDANALQYDVDMYVH